jgi:hypothetical protein
MKVQFGVVSDKSLESRSKTTHKASSPGGCFRTVVKEYYRDVAPTVTLATIRSLELRERA